MVHCASANRVGAVWLAHRVLDAKIPVEASLAEARAVGLRTSAYEQRAYEYIAAERKKAAAHEKSVRPGINEKFLSADLDASQWLARFEIESREVFAQRSKVVTAIGIKPGDNVADIGAGTGIYTRAFASVVGSAGKVVAVDIAQGFLKHIEERATAEGLTNIATVQCSQDSVDLPADSVDVAFVCDTYHHFEYPRSTLASIRKALKKGGTLVVIDFERIPGKSREFILGHVRAGKDVFRSEIEAAGFEFVEEVKIDGFEENYFLRFRKPLP
ncbi:methyltransferase domain-containing protein [bacterium]|nr:methyltransferase domain-containing protein [bacterium]